MAIQFEIVVGTYEEFLLGYRIGHAKNNKGCSLVQSFATHSHGGSVRAVASSGRYLASGGTDDKIFIYDMRTRKEIQMLMHHNGTVNTLAFTPRATHIITGGADGIMSAMRTGNWQMEKLWGSAHKGSSVNDIAVHPSGKLALSLGGDHILRTWNLVKGRMAYATNLGTRGPDGKLCNTVHWSLNGENFAITGAAIVEVWNVATAGVVNSFKCSEKSVSIVWVTDNRIIIGLEDGKFAIFNTDTAEENVIQAHEKRIKCLAFSRGYVVSACSSGIIKLWSISENADIKEICFAKTGCRITCITLVDDDEVKLEKSGKPGTKDTSIKNVESDEDDIEDTSEDKTNYFMKAPKRRNEFVEVETEENDSFFIDKKKVKEPVSAPSKKQKKFKEFIVETVDSPVIPSISSDEIESSALNETTLKVKSKKCKKIKQEVTDENYKLCDTEKTEEKKKTKKSRNIQTKHMDETEAYETPIKLKKNKSSVVKDTLIEERTERVNGSSNKEPKNKSKSVEKNQYNFAAKTPQKSKLEFHVKSAGATKIKNRNMKKRKSF